jgi:hypothetical protein
MDERERSPNEPSSEVPQRPIAWQQVIFDDIFLILMLGLVIPTLFYLVWGLMDLASVPTFEP